MKITKTISSFYLQDEWPAPPRARAYTLKCILSPDHSRASTLAGSWAATDTGECLFTATVSLEPRARILQPTDLLSCLSLLGCSSHLTHAPWDCPLPQHMQPCLCVSLQPAARPFTGFFPGQQDPMVVQVRHSHCSHIILAFFMLWKGEWDGGRMLSPDTQNLRLHLGSA